MKSLNKYKCVGIFVISFLMLWGCAEESLHIKVNDPVVIGSAYYDDYCIALQMYEGSYESEFVLGANGVSNWKGKYELIIADTVDGKIVQKFALEDWSETMNFQEQGTLHITDYNNDGILEVLIGQYGTTNFNVYHMYYITPDLEIGYFSEIGELMISSKELSPILEVKDGMVAYSVYDNSVGGYVIQKIDMQDLEYTK